MSSPEVSDTDSVSEGEEVPFDQIQFASGCRKTVEGEDIEDIIIRDEPPRKRPPIVPGYFPYSLKLEPGKTYKWCTCGRSKKQPWCDNSHKPGDPKPLRFTASKKGQSWYLICGCKYTLIPPHCDGSHAYVHYGYEEPEYLEEVRKKKAQREAEAKAKAADTHNATAPKVLCLDATAAAAANVRIEVEGEQKQKKEEDKEENKENQKQEGCCCSSSSSSADEQGSESGAADAVSSDQPSASSAPAAPGSSN